METPAKTPSSFRNAFTVIELLAVKRKPFLNGLWLTAMVFLGVLTVNSCSDRGEPLPGGYFIFIASGSEMFLSEPKYGGSIPELGTDLEEIGNHNEFIFGRSGSDRGAKPGYFLLNTNWTVPLSRRGIEVGQAQIRASFGV